METLNRIMVGLDLTPMDDNLIAYSSFLCAQLNVKKVLFIHIEKSLELPAELMENLERQEVSAYETMRGMIASKVDPAFAGKTGCEVEILIEEGKPLKQLLHWSKEKEVDLMLVGRKLRLQGSGVLAQKLLRTGNVSMLFVPETFEPRLNRIVVSVDFSEYSDMALDRVLHSALAQPNIRVTCLHIYQVPTGYRTLGMSYEEFDERMQGFARQKYDKMLDRFPELQERAELLLVRQGGTDDVGELVVLEAKRIRADMLVIGAKGMSAAALFVIGSVTEKVLRHDMDIPLLVFKRKDKEMGFLDAILSS